MKSLMITGLVIQVDQLTDKQPHDEAKDAIEAINEAIAGLNGNPAVLGGPSLDRTEVTVMDNPDEEPPEPDDGSEGFDAGPGPSPDPIVYDRC